MKKLLLLFVCAFAMNSQAQWTYNPLYFVDAGNPSGTNTEGDAIGLGTWTNIMLGPQATNLWSPATAIPFAFDFFGTPVTHFKASQNGLVTFDTSTVLLPNVNDNLPSINLPNNTICAFWDEFTITPPTGTGDDIRINVFGTAPNRQFWIRWYSFEIGNPTNSFVYSAVVLEETTNNVYIVDQYSNTTPLTSTVGVQLDPLTAIQYGTNTINISGNGSGLADNDYYCFAPELLVNDNAGVISLDNPLIPLIAGIHNVDVSVKNYGLNDLSSFAIDWEINGTPQVQYVYGGGPISSGLNSASLNVGTYNFPIGFTSLKFWTVNPNGNADNQPSNDTLEITACTALNGTYSIGGITPDFATINDAIIALNSCGINGPVIFNIAPGTYNEQITMIPVNGSSATNTITFDGGDANTTAISMATTGQWALIGLDGADYVTWKNLTVENTATTDGAGFGFWNDAHHNTVDSCRILLDPLGDLDLIGVMISGDPVNDFIEGVGNDYITVSNCYIEGGEMAVHIEGDPTLGAWNSGLQLLNNEFNLQDDYGVYMDNIDTITISGNYIHDVRVLTGDGLYCFDIAHFYFNENRINVPDYGIYVADGNFDFVVSGMSSITNNMVKSETDYAMYLDDVNQTYIWHNTAYGVPGMRVNDLIDCDIRNNIFTSDVDYAFESDDDLTLTNVTVDYNLYWTPTSNTFFAKHGLGIHANLSDWQFVTPSQNVASLELFPHFVSSDDLHRIGPNGNDVGDNAIGVTVDVDYETRPMTPSLIVDMGADEYTPIADDAVAVAIIPNGSACGDSLTDVYMVVTNYGVNTITSLPITIEATGAVTATISTVYTTPIAFYETDTILVGTINTYAGGTVDFTGWTTLVGDQNTSNDTVTGIGNFIPYIPVAFGAYDCGTDSATVTALSGYPVLYEWYDAPVGGNLVGIGDSYTIPSVSTQDTYYVQYSSSFSSLFTSLTGGNGCGGGNMVDLVSAGGTALSSFAVHNDDGAGIPFNVSVYYRVGTYVGNETNPGAWISAGSYTAISGGVGSLSSVVSLTSPIQMPAGTTIALYIACDVDYTNGTNTYTNGDVTLYTGAGLCSEFGGVNPGREFNGELYFGGVSCSSVRTPVTATIVPGVNVDFGADTLICNDNLVLDAGHNGPLTIWTWSDTTATSQTYTVTTSGAYWVNVVDSVGCSDSDTINVSVGNISVALDPASNVGCTGDTTIITPTVISTNPYSFNWSSGDTTEIISVATDNTYQFTVQDSVGCTESASSIIQFVDPPVASFTSNQNMIDVTVTSTATNADSTVFDFGDGTTYTGTGTTHTYTANGNYVICQYVYNDCSTDTFCIQVSITQVSLEELGTNISIKPNPANDYITVTTEGLTMDRLEVLTTDGKLLYEQSVNGTQTIINVSNLPVGVYFIHLTGASGEGIKRFIKQ